MPSNDIKVWLIEWPGDDSNPVRWWREGPNSDGSGGWKRDAFKATWFHRQQDAEDFRAGRMLHGRVTEHVFLD